MREGTYDLIIIGGGLAGLSCALHLGAHDLHILLIEKYEYPHHKVCGEYVSNEILPYLQKLGIDPLKAGAKPISKFKISSPDGTILKSRLPLGGFGISRYALDNLLYNKVKERCEVLIDTVVTIDPSSNSIETQSGKHYKGLAIAGAFGKRSNLDKFLKRSFLRKKSPWLGVKAHYEYDHPEDTVTLHNFDGGYCGLSQTEDGKVNACYLASYQSFRPFGDLEEFQNKVMSRNPYLKEFFTTAKMTFPKPLTISQISFDQKQAVEQGVFMIGDSAGLIHPLCGNGMAMAIHGAKIFSELFLKYISSPDFDRSGLEEAYLQSWHTEFGSRLKTGYRVQSLLLNPTTASLGFKIASWFPGIIPNIIKRTHGEVVV